MPVSIDTGIVVHELYPGEGRRQSSPFPPTPDELVPEDHLVRVIEAYVARSDLQVLGFNEARPQKTGRPSHDPGDLPTWQLRR